MGAALIGGVAAFVVLRTLGPGSSDPDPVQVGLPPAAALPAKACDYRITRLTGHHMVAPLISAEPECESAKLAPMMKHVEAVVDSFRAAGVLNTASVYVRSFSDGGWSALNGNARYRPGSMLKVAVMIACYRMDEEQPGFFKRRLPFEGNAVVSKTQFFPSEQHIVPGRSYTPVELLEHMMAHSDNQATNLLMQHIDVPLFQRVFAELGMPVPELTAKDYHVSASEFSVFIKALYNGSLLSVHNSEAALELLARSSFVQGIVAGLPKGTLVAHKFGEAGNQNEGTYQLHESALVFGGARPYLLTVMTEGPDMMKLPQVLAAVSARVHAGIPK